MASKIHIKQLLQSGASLNDVLKWDGTNWVGSVSSGGVGVTDGDKGDITVTGTGATWTIDPNVVSLAKLAQVSTATFLGRTTAATGNVESLTATQATALLNEFTTTVKGLVPAAGSSTGRYLKDDGTWSTLGLPAIQSVSSSATVTPTFSNDQVNITAQAVALTLANPTGTAVDGWGIAVRIKDNGTARTIAYGAQYRAIGVTLPTTTVISKTLYLGMVFNNADTKWDVVAVAQQA